MCGQRSGRWAVKYYLDATDESSDTEWILTQCMWQSGREAIYYYLDSTDGSGGR